MFIQRRPVRVVLLLSLSVGLGLACAPEPKPEVERVAGKLTTCVTVRRGVFGSVADATMWQINTVQRGGGMNPLRTGASSTGPVFVVLNFDLSSIPAGSRIESADLTLYRNSALSASDPAALMSIYRVTAPWVEADINYANFANAYDGSTVWSSMNVAGYGFKSTSVTSLVQAWVDGTPNYGFYLRQPVTPDTTYPSSEHADISRRPGLTVCYSDQAPGVDAGSPADVGPQAADTTAPADVLVLADAAVPSADAAPSSLDTGAVADAAPLSPSGCLTIRRGALGNVADTTILQNSPSQANGAMNPNRTGTSSAGFSRSLVQFDLSPLPPGAAITSASMTLYVGSNLTSSDPRAVVRVHRATQPWGEATATWATFGDGLAFDPLPGALLNVAGYGFRSVDVTTLAQSWLAFGNQGLVLSQDDAPSTTYSSSEHPTVDRRPSLAVCYVTGGALPDAGAPPADASPAVDTTPGVDAALGIDTAPPADALVADSQIPVDAQPAVDTMIAVDSAPPVDTGPPSGCVTIRRGSGNASDTMIWRSQPSVTNGETTPIRSGVSSVGFVRSLLSFDLAPIPPASVILSASLTLYVGSPLGASDPNAVVRIHRATQPWSEASVTWASFADGAAFDPLPVSTLNVAGYGFRSADVKSLVESWLAGGNNGLVLDQNEVTSTTYSSAEHPTLDRRPTLQVCYAPNP